MRFFNLFVKLNEVKLSVKMENISISFLFFNPDPPFLSLPFSLSFSLPPGDHQLRTRR